MHSIRNCHVLRSNSVIGNVTAMNAEAEFDLKIVHWIKVNLIVNLKTARFN